MKWKSEQLKESIVPILEVRFLHFYNNDVAKPTVITTRSPLFTSGFMHANAEAFLDRLDALCDEVSATRYGHEYRFEFDARLNRQFEDFNEDFCLTDFNVPTLFNTLTDAYREMIVEQLVVIDENGRTTLFTRKD